jgi:hypothetical protein
LPRPPSQLQQQTIDSIRNNTKQVAASELDLTALASYKRILMIDDDTDTAFTFKLGLEACYDYTHNKTRFEVYSYNNPLVALSEFKPHFYDLLLTDINLY